MITLREFSRKITLSIFDRATCADMPVCSVVNVNFSDLLTLTLLSADYRME